MIQFQRNSVNSVVVTLTELSTLTNPIYLFKFVCQHSSEVFYFIATDESSYKERFNAFTVTDKANPNTLNGEVQLTLDGYYDYYVYETNLASTSGLTDAIEAVGNIVTEVENGLVWVQPSTQAIDRYNPSSLEAIVYGQ